MMAKYKGKYNNCRTCIHVEIVHMVMVSVKNTCPKAIEFSGVGIMTTKEVCEKCEYHEEKRVDG